DPTLPQPGQAPATAPGPGVFYPVPGGPSEGLGGVSGVSGAHLTRPPDTVAAQGVVSDGGAYPGPRHVPQAPPGQAPPQPQHGNGEAAAVAAAVAGAGVPIAAPAAAAAIRRAREAASGPKPGIGRVTEAPPARLPGMAEGHVGGAGRVGAGHT